MTRQERIYTFACAGAVWLMTKVPHDDADYDDNGVDEVDARPQLHP